MNYCDTTASWPILTAILFSVLYENLLCLHCAFRPKKKVSINMYKLFLQTAASFGGLFQLALQVFWIWIWVHSFATSPPPCMHSDKWFPWLLLAKITVDHILLLGCYLVQYTESKTLDLICFLISSWHIVSRLAVNILVWVKIDFKILLWESAYIFSLLW